MGRGKREWGAKGGGSVNSQPGIRADGDLHHDTKEGFQVSKGRIPRDKGRDSKQKEGIIKRIGACTPCIYHASCVSIVLTKDCV